MSKVFQASFLLIITLLFTVQTAIANDSPDSEEFKAVEACLTVAIDVPDAGAYAEFCIERYRISLAARVTQ